MHAGGHSAGTTLRDAGEDVNSAPMSGARAFRLSVVTGSDEFAKLGERWNALALHSGATIYQTFEWNWLWWKHYGSHPSRKLRLLLLYSEETLAGIAPLFVQESSAAGVVLHRSLRFIGSGNSFALSDGLFLDDGVSDYLDFIVDKDSYQEMSSAFIEHLKQASPPLDDVLLLNTAERSPVMNVLRLQCIAHGVRVKATEADVCSRIEVPESLDTYVKEQSSNVRRRFSQARKAYQAGGTHRICTIHSEAEFEAAFGDLVRLHQHRWNTLGYPGLFADERFERFQREVALLFMDKGWLLFKTSNINGTCVATRLAFTFNGCLYDYLSGFDPALSTTKQRPGLGLLLAMIEDSIGADVKHVDFLRGDEKYKFEFNPVIDHNWNIQLSGFSGGRGVRHLLHRVLKKTKVMSYLLGREWKLLRVQWRVHGFPACIVSYARFRLIRITNKFAKRGMPSGETVSHVSISKNS